MALFDTMNHIKSKVVTINLGLAASMVRQFGVHACLCLHTCLCVRLYACCLMLRKGAPIEIA